MKYKIVYKQFFTSSKGKYSLLKDDKYVSFGKHIGFETLIGLVNNLDIKYMPCVNFNPKHTHLIFETDDIQELANFGPETHPELFI